MLRHIHIVIVFMIPLGFGVATAQDLADAAQRNQRVLIEELGVDQSRYRVLNEIAAIPPESIGPELRAALIEELERINGLKELSRSTGVGFDSLESLDYVFALHRAVAELRDPSSIPALARAMGNNSVVAPLADYGELAVPAVLEIVTDPASNHYLVDDGLRVLRLMVENQQAQPLSSETLSLIHSAAEQRLAGTQYFTTVWYAIDLAAALDDPEFEQKLGLIASYPAEVLAFGIEDPNLIAQTQRRASDRLDGVPAKPRREDYPE